MNRAAASIVLGLAVLCMPGKPASAYSAKTDAGGACSKDGTSCDVYCDNGDLAGWMYWDGSDWTDGVRSSDDFDTAARQICAAHSATCT